MKAPDAMTVVLGVMTAMSNAHAQMPTQSPTQTPTREVPQRFEQLAAECAPDVHPMTLKGVVRTESSGNPYAIGVVGGRLARQPRNREEALATARDLERQGFNFSVGLGQVNRYNLAKYGETYETGFEPCRNLKAGSAILKACFERAHTQIGDEQQALRAAFSCYYSGNFTRGFRAERAGQPSYVQKVVANATDTAQPIPVVPAVKLESADDAASVRRAGGPSMPANSTRLTTPAWVIFADASQQDQPAAMQPELTKEPVDTAVVKVRFKTPAGAAARAGQSTTLRGADEGRRQRSTPNSIQQDAPFVQFVD
ncbi:lytic transglycosylase domain-containing protein [Caballeronia humi]|uniref:Lytic transglycosylase, catalytic n=1 Tax=Caballeronia humi TaxID=326474 RepID=A0A158IV13_9BURK|nr:lytic transglycosylase domain-containing protein [Caballeronia humi]SAL60103.1 lytic transglycosylase, catalytic [Caballeronia humi]